MLKDRVLTAVALLAGFLAALFFLPAAGWLLLCAVVCGAAAWEWGGLARFDAPLRASTAVVFGMACLMFGFLAGLGSGQLEASGLLFPLYALSAVFWLFGVPLWLANKWKLDNPLIASAVGFIVLIPTALALAHLRAIGPLALLAAMAVVWIADIAAYFSGRAFGRHKLAPSISPGKTWEGAAGAAAAVLLFGFGILTWAGESQPVGAGLIALILLVWTAVSIIGDLFESLLKRQAGLKDSGTILPGHGGILDRIDSLTSTLPLVALAALWFAR